MKAAILAIQPQKQIKHLTNRVKWAKHIYASTATNSSTPLSMPEITCFYGILIGSAIFQQAVDSKSTNHIPALVTPCSRWVHSEAVHWPRRVVHADKSAAPCCCSVYCLHRLMHFNGERPRTLPLHPGDPGPDLTHGSLNLPESSNSMSIE